MDSPPQTATATARPSVRGGLVATAAICAATLLVAAFEPAMAGWPSGLVDMLLLPLAAFLFIGCAVWSLTQLLRIGPDGAGFAGPFMLCAATLTLLLHAPLQDVYLQYDFHRHRSAREAIVAQVARGELKPNVADDGNLIALGDNGPSVSLGNEIVVDEADNGGSYVLFPITRGLDHAFSGFLHVPASADPKGFFEFDDKPPTQLKPCGNGWYFAAN